jgi:K+-sensing histidine kinase KdpD
MGLGLSIARSIVIGHGGTIELLDAIPRGLLVRIGLPQPSVQG